MNQITQINIGARPAHLPAATPDQLAINQAAFANWQSGFPVLSMRGRVWRVRMGGNEDAITASPGPNMPETAVPWVPVVIVGVSEFSAKQYYAQSFNEQEMNRRPDCFSIDGIEPDSAAPNKQNPTCANCRNNVWGTAINSPSGRGKACRDFKRLAVVFVNDMDCEAGPMLLMLPPTSVPHFQDYVARLTRNQAAVNQVVTMMQFDLDKTAPTVTFSPQGWLDATQYMKAVELGGSANVHRMLEQEWGEGGEQAGADTAQLPPRPTHIPPVAQVAPVPVAAPAPQPVAAVPTPTPMPMPAARARPTAFANPSVLTTQMASTAQPVQAAPAPAPAPAPAMVKGAPPDMQAAIDSLLGT